jgi:hypothetical protein
MLYRPKYCCNCSEKIERVDWNLLTSRRFCDVCAIENKRYDHLPRIAVGVGVLSLMFGLGTLFGGSANSGQPVESLNASPVHLKTERSAERQAGQARAENPPVAAPATNSGSRSPDPSQAVHSNRSPQETVNYCGALTKKGTPCSRKVKAAGLRCFQHEGKPSAPHPDEGL